MCHGNVMNSAICPAVSPVPSSFTQLRKAQSSCIPSSVTGEEAEPQTHFHTVLAQHTWDDSKTKAHATTSSDLFFLLLDGHVSATKPSPQLQRNCYFNSPVPTQANASAAQGNQHPVLMDYATRVERKQRKVLKKQKPVDSIPVSP